MEIVGQIEKGIHRVEDEIYKKKLVLAALDLDKK